jgi:adenylyltransferase/sulfurtransferase
LSESPANLDRYIRQMRYAPLGRDGQARLAAGRVLLCGCGALGSVIANTLARAGVGYMRIVDRDFLELNNLQRQVLYDEADVAAGLPKVIAAADKLRRINSQIEIEPIVADLSHANIRSLADGVDLILDGTDNFETRLLVNDYAVDSGRPWVYGGCIGAEGQSMTILPGRSACLACFMPDAPPPGTTPTCDTAGIVGPIVNVVASIQSMEAIKILSGKLDAVSTHLTVIDLWENRIRRVDMRPLWERGTCRACHHRDLSWLAGKRGSHSAVLCGRNAVQLSPDDAHRVSLEQLAGRLQSVGEVFRNPFLLRLKVDQYVITVFPDGRAIVAGTDDQAVARTVHAKYIGA